MRKAGRNSESRRRPPRNPEIEVFRRKSLPGAVFPGHLCCAGRPEAGLGSGRLPLRGASQLLLGLLAKTPDFWKRFGRCPPGVDSRVIRLAWVKVHPPSPHFRTQRSQDTYWFLCLSGLSALQGRTWSVLRAGVAHVRAARGLRSDFLGKCVNMLLWIQTGEA